MSDIGIVIQKFYVKYVEKEFVLETDPATGRILRQEKRTVPVEMVLIGPRGATNKTLTPWRVADLKRVLPPEPGAPSLWDAVRPAYEAWKRNEEIPLNGTPLEAWGGLSEDEIAAVKAIGIRTVEDFGAVTDGQIGEIRILGARAKRDQARTYAAAADQRQAASEIATLKEQVAELMAQLRERSDEEPAKRRPGRPRKEASETEEEAA